MPNKPDLRTVAAEERDLRARLEKAEESLREILSGESDALFVAGAGGAQLFALKGADQSYRTLIESMSEGALTLTPAGLILYANRRFSEMLRTPLEKVIGSGIHAWFTPESRQVLQGLLRKDAVGNRREELALAAADGTQVPVNLSVSHLKLEGMPDSFCMVATDLTEQKRNEAILAAERLARAILEQSADAIVICDQTGRIIRASKQAQALYGKNPLGQLFGHAYPLRQSDGTAFSPVGDIDTNRRLSVEARLERDGQGFDLLVSVGHLKGARNKLLGSVITLTDITERKQAEDKLLESKHLLQLVVESVPSRIFWKDRDLRYLGCNTRFAKDAGISNSSELIGKTDFEMTWRDKAELYRNDDMAVMESGTPKLNIEEPQTTPDGNTIWLSTSKVPLRDKDNRIIGVLGLYRDITEHIRAERELRESERRFRNLLGNVELLSMMLDREARITYCNDYLLRLTGWKREEVIGKDWWDIFVPPELNDLKDTVFAKLLDNQPEALHHENDIVTRSGERRLIRWNNSVLRSGDGEIVGTASIGEDITERRRAKEALRTSEQQYRILFESMDEGFCRVEMINDPDGKAVDYRFLEINPAFEKQTGLHQAQGKTIRQMVPDHEASWFDLYGKVALTGEAIRFESPADAMHRFFDVFAFRIGGDGSRNVGILFRDITGRKHMEESLKNMAEKYHAMFEKSSDAIMLLNENGVLDCNEATLRMFGCPTRDDFISKHPAEFSPPIQPGGDDSMSLANQHLATAIKNGSDLFEWRHRRFDGAEFPAEVLLTAMELDGKALLQGVVRDITERKTAEARITHLNRVLLVLSSINTLIVRVNDRDELFREACNIAVESGGFRMAMLVVVDPVTTLPVSITSAGKNEELLADIKNVLSSGEGMQKSLVGRAIREKRAVISNDTQNDPRLLHGKQYTAAGVKSMTVLPLIISGKALGTIALYASEFNFFQKDEMQLLTELAGDIAYAIDHINKQERLEYLAYYDELTGLANRTLFLERVAQYIRSADRGGHKLAIGLIDLERFKNINDSLGRPAGDALLKQLAEWLTQFARDASLLARIDADHFAFVVPEVKSDGNLAKLVDNIAKTFQAQPFRVNNTELRLAARAGIALFPDDGADAETVFRNAEAALKAAKKGGDRYLFHAKKMTEAVAAKLTVENQLRQALDNEEFVLHYQPKVNIATGKLTGAEALIRWNDPRTGLVVPGRFIPVLEETGLIYEVGRWALRKAIADYLRWRDAGLPAVRIAVNVSPLQLRNINFLDQIRQVIALDSHAAEGLELEITESVIMDNIEFNIASLQAIRALGVTIAIDDFGTGFSSLSYLARLPIDTLKIDRAFVIEMTAGPEGLALVSTIINLAHALKRKVVAEGVETEEQSRLLRLLGCDEMQGFLFSKPVPAETFETKFLGPPPAV